MPVVLSLSIISSSVIFPFFFCRSAALEAESPSAAVTGGGRGSMTEGRVYTCGAECNNSRIKLSVHSASRRYWIPCPESSKERQAILTLLVCSGRGATTGGGASSSSSSSSPPLSMSLVFVDEGSVPFLTGCEKFHKK